MEFGSYSHVSDAARTNAAFWAEHKLRVAAAVSKATN